jgi:competence protein ComEC
VPQKRAIDIIDGRNYSFVGDSDLLANDFLRNFHLKPSRILYRMNAAETIPGLVVADDYINYNGKHILLVDKPVSFVAQQTKPIIDLLVISKNPKVYMAKLTQTLDIKQVVFDGSVPAWKTSYWKKDCDSLHIPWHDVTMKGAFEMRVD